MKAERRKVAETGDTHVRFKKGGKGRKKATH
jgi:hypothetical protein